MADWQLALELDPSITPAIEQLLEARGGSLESAVPEGYDTTPEHEWRVVTFPAPADLSLVDAVGSWLRNFHSPDARFLTRHAGEPWALAWQGVYNAQPVSTRVWVAPTWAPAPDEAEVSVILDPTLAFGGGAHATTVGMLNLLDKLLHDNHATTVLDVGSGSGILAIAAAKLGADAVGVEIDSHAVAESEKNVALNGVSEKVEIRAGTMDAVRPDETFDVVVANVYASVLTAVAPQIQAACRDHLLLTGFYAHKIHEILQAYPGMVLETEYTIRDWIMLHLRVDPNA